MSHDDDLIRRALRPPDAPRVASIALRELQPAFTRRRRRRRALMGAAGALLLSGSAAAYSVATRPAPTSLRLSGSPSMPMTAEPEATATIPAPSTTLELLEIPTTSADLADLPGAAAPAASAPGLPADARPSPTAPPASPSPSRTIAPPAPPTPDSTISPTTIASPATTAPATGIAPSTTRQLVSDCGTVTVVLDGSTVRIVSMTPSPGYTASVGDDGPQSIEVKFDGPVGTCELHAELKSSDLDVEIQNPRG